MSLPISKGALLGGLALILLVVLAAASPLFLGRSGSDASPQRTGVAAAAPGYLDWPQFGRVPERTHYLPADEKALDPPLKQAWSINTHALIEFPPAIHNGVAYVINKYGNGKAVRLSDHKVLWELNVRPSDKGKPNFVTAPVYYRGRVYGAFLTGNLAAGDAKTGAKDWVRRLPGHLESSPMAAGGLLYLGTDAAKVLALDPATGATRWTFDAPG